MKTTRKNFLYFLIVILSLLLLAYILRGHIYFYYLTHFVISKNNIEKISITPTEHEINKNISYKNFKTLSNDSIEFNVPWTDIKETKNKKFNTGETRTIVYFESGNSMDFYCFKNEPFLTTTYDADYLNIITEVFNINNKEDNYEFTKKLYEVKPSDYKFFISKKDLTKLAIALPLKSLRLMNESYIYNFENDNFKGFQYDMESGVYLEIEDNNNQLCTIPIRNKSVTQDEIDYIISTIKIKK